MEDQSDDTLAQVVKGGEVSFLGKLGGQVIRLLLLILTSRILGPHVYGLYALGKSIWEIANIFALMGFTTGTVNFVAIYHGEQDRSKLKGVILTSILLPASVSIVIAAALFFSAAWIATSLFEKPDLAPVIQGFAGVLPFYSVVSVAANTARGLRNIKRYTFMVDLLHPFLELTLVAVLFTAGYRLGGAVLAFVLASAVAAGYGLYYITTIFRRLGLRDVPATFQVKRQMSYSASVLVIGVLRRILTRSNRIMLGLLATTRDVGLFAVPALVSQKAGFLQPAFNSIFAPVIADLNNKGKVKELASTFKSVTRLVTALTLPVIILFSAFPTDVIRIFGSDYLPDGASVLVILAVAQLVNISAGPVGFVLVMTGHQKLEMINGWALAGLNVLMNYLLIPPYGAVGAAIGTGTSIAAINIVRLVEVYAIHGYHPYRFSTFKTIAASVLSLAVALSLKFVTGASGFAVIPIALLTLAVYFGATKLLGFEHEDLHLLKLLKRRFSQLKGLVGFKREDQ